jgi:hypothetical protein
VSKKDFESIAEAFAHVKPPEKEEDKLSQREVDVQAVINVLADANERFNPSYFRRACGLKG